MPRINVPLVTGETYHIYNRGVDKRDIFIDESDYIRFYSTLGLFNQVDPILNYTEAKRTLSQTAKNLVELQAYCLLPNHFHLILKQLVDGGISEFMKRISGGYTCHFNEKYSRSGALFQGKFKRVYISSDEQYRYVFAYVNENHLVHGLKKGLDVYHTSRVHYSGIKKSSAINAAAPAAYDASESRKNAFDIYARRKDKENHFLLET